MIEINKPGIELVLTSNGHYEWLPQSLYFTDTGLYVLRLRACEVGTDIPVTVSDGKEERTVCISSILHRQGQRVYLSSGDEIYIDKVPAVYDYFFNGILSHASVIGTSFVLHISGVGSVR